MLRCSTMMVKIACDRLECWFINVLPVVRKTDPYSRNLRKEKNHTYLRLYKNTTYNSSRKHNISTATLGKHRKA